MEFLVTMTMRVPSGTPPGEVAHVRAREAAADRPDDPAGEGAVP